MKFHVFGKVIGKQRPRVTQRGTYTPKKTLDYERLIAESYIKAGGSMMSGQISVSIAVFRALPKSRPKKIASEPDTVKPDVDNIAKTVLDALNGVAYADDSQVVRLVVNKFPRERREEHITVWIDELK